MLKLISDLQDNEVFDVVVLGAGGAGMSAAVYAASAGAKVLLVESTGHVGGTTAYSAGTTWVPGTHLAPQVNPEDTLANAERFLDAAVGERSGRDIRQALLQHGPAAVAAMEKSSHLKYRIRPFHPDYLSELPGATTCGRALEPLPFDGRLLGDWFPLVRPPIPEFLVLGGMMVDRDDIPHLLGFKKSLKSLAYVLKILARHASDRLSHPRGTRLLMGNALIARLLLTLKERGTPIVLNTQASALHRNASGQVDAVTLRQTLSANDPARPLEKCVRVRGGVILASGGFNRHPGLRAQYLPGVPDEWCPGAPGHTGQAHELALAVGATYGSGHFSPCFWAPVSKRKRADGSTAVFPHFVFDRAKPGTVTVNAQGQRFLNESTSYHLFGVTMQGGPVKPGSAPPSIPAYLITDAQGMRKYGLGMVRPGGMGLASALADGYLTQAHSVEELARKLNMPAANLQATLQRLGEYAKTGVDEEFQRGTTLYQRAMGIQTDACARALDASGQPIGGLYAVGNDMQSSMGGVYPAPGITIGPGLVFAYLAVQDALQRR